MSGNDELMLPSLMAAVGEIIMMALALLIHAHTFLIFCQQCGDIGYLLLRFNLKPSSSQVPAS